MLTAAPGAPEPGPEEVPGTKYKKLGEDGPQFPGDIRENIKNGTFQLLGKGTLKRGEPEALIHRGRGVTIVLRAQ